MVHYAHAHYIHETETDIQREMHTCWYNTVDQVKAIILGIPRCTLPFTIWMEWIK